MTFKKTYIVFKSCGIMFPLCMGSSEATPVPPCVTWSPLTLEESCINILLNVSFLVPRKNVIQGEVDFWVNSSCRTELGIS